MPEKIEFDSEFELHKLTQEHLELFDLKLIASEFQLNDLRLDNLAFNMNTNSFVIIEYKNTGDDNVLIQAQSYYDLLKDNKHDFCERLNKELGSSTNIDFSKTKVMIIGPKFSKVQIEEVKNKNNFELWKVSLYDNGDVFYQNIITNDCAEHLNIDLNSLKLTYENLFEGKSEKLQGLYGDLEKKLKCSFDDLKIRILVDAVSFRVCNKLICLANIKNKNIKIHFFSEKLNDCEGKTRDISNITTGGLANYELIINSKDEIDYALKLFKQVYDEKSSL